MGKKTIFWIVGIIVIGYVGCFAFGFCVVPKLLKNLFPTDEVKKINQT
tara:strand:+ start:614 stop:757 length:144 start_codon:yes stop_codon:yes gene_type:complete